MIRLYILFPLLILGMHHAFGQVNDICATAIDISDLVENADGLVANYCSSLGQFDNENSSLTTDVPCFNSGLRDVWFRFRPAKQSASITVIGDREENGGGTLKRPDIGVFGGDCSMLISVACQSTIDNFGLVRLTSLSPGEPYYIRVGSLPENRGTFQLCINDFLIDVDANEGCYDATRLCTKEAISIDTFPFSPDVSIRELKSCIGGFESNKRAIWYSFTAANTGLLNFLITPRVETNNLNFAVFRLSQNIEECLEEGELLRCMGSGPTSISPDGCLGAIGLRSESQDERELLGCSDAYDNFLTSLNATQGEQFLLVISNEGAKDGFDLEFSGTLEFETPVLELAADRSEFCNGDDITISIADESFLEDNVVAEWSWKFGETAEPDSSDTQGPHTVLWSEPGDKTISSRFITNDGCEVETSMTIAVTACCDPRNPLIAAAAVDHATCYELANGAIDLSIAGGEGPYIIAWNDGMNAMNRSELLRGEYEVTISDQKLCDTIMELDIIAPDSLRFESTVVLPECGEPNGTINLSIFGGEGDYGILWDPAGSYELDITKTALLPAVYPISVRDENQCIYTAEIDLTTVAVLQVDSTSSTLKPPSCNGDKDGIFDLVMSGGTAPYTFDYGDGLGAGEARMFSNFGDTTFTVLIRDGEGCLERRAFQFREPEPFRLDSMDIEGLICHDDLDGNLRLYAAGGTAPYDYLLNGTAYSLDSNRTISSLSPRLYDLAIEDANGCAVADRIDFRPPQIVEPLEINEFNITRGEVIDVMVPIGSGTTIEWLTTSDISCVDCKDPIIATEETREYRYQLTAPNGCISEHSISVNVEPRIPVYIPNAFSPNLDGVNDELYVYAIEPVREIKLFSVYDRWGALLYSKANPEPGIDGWDGRYKGKVLGNGSFMYLVEVVLQNGNTKHLSGLFNIVN